MARPGEGGGAGEGFYLRFREWDGRAGRDFWAEESFEQGRLNFWKPVAALSADGKAGGTCVRIGGQVRLVMHHQGVSVGGIEVGVLIRPRLRSVGDEEYKIGVLRSLSGATDSFCFDRIVRLAHACEILERDGPAIEGSFGREDIARGAWFIEDDGAAETEECVKQTAFAHIGAT